MPELFAPVCSIVATQRRRFFWAAWWSAPPEASPFRAPDASNGGAHSRGEALAEAERRAGRGLVVIEPKWARAFLLLIQGRDPALALASRRNDRVKLGGSAARPEGGARMGVASRSVWETLGVPPGASVQEIKRAYFRRALDVHPDHGGSAEAFRELHRAYVCASERRERPRRRVRR